jgi:hypothetical protein
MSDWTVNPTGPLRDPSYRWLQAALPPTRKAARVTAKHGRQGTGIMRLNTNYLSAVTLSIVIVAAGMFLSSTHARADAAAGEVTYNAKSVRVLGRT